MTQVRVKKWFAEKLLQLLHYLFLPKMRQCEHYGALKIFMQCPFYKKNCDSICVLSG